MNLEEFERETDEAYSFLASRYGYSFDAAKRGGYFQSAFVRTFRKDTKEITLVMGNADSPHFLNIFFDDGLDAYVDKTSYMQRSLSVLLRSRSPEFEHPLSEDLKTPESRVEALYVYASLIESYALDVVEGDFSGFPTLVFALHHTDETTGRYRFIGVYTTLDLVNEAITERQEKHGYIERRNGFEIWRIELDGLGNWYAGIPIDDDIEA